MKTGMILVFFSLMLLGCNKETVNFHIKIINPATGEGYPNTQFAVISERTGTNGEVVKTEAQGTTNSAGEANVTVSIKASLSYYVTIEALPNICYVDDIRKYYNDRTDKNPEFIFEIAPCGTLQINVKNVNCQGASDKIVFHFKPVYLEGIGNMLPLERFGCYENEFVQETVPMGNWIATWEVTKNGVTTNHDSLFYIPVNQLYYFNLFY